VRAGPRHVVDLLLEVVVLLDEPGQLGLDQVEEGVHLVFVITALAYRRFLERDVVHVRWSQGHRITSGRRDTGQTTASADGTRSGSS
jgi:hypothetical protein